MSAQLWFVFGVALVGLGVAALIWVSELPDNSADDWPPAMTDEELERYWRDTEPEVLPDEDYGVDETGYAALHALQEVPDEIGDLAFSDPLGYEISASLWEWERLSVEFFNARVDDALAKFVAGEEQRVPCGAEYPVVDVAVIAADLPRWRLDVAHSLVTSGTSWSRSETGAFRVVEV